MGVKLLSSLNQNKRALQNLIARANATTGKTDTDLTSSVESLIAGYGQGGGIATNLYKFNDTLNKNGSFETYSGLETIPDGDFQNGVSVKVASMSMDGEVIDLPEAFPAIFYPVYIHDNFAVYMYTEYNGESSAAPIHIIFANGNQHSDYDSVTFEIVDYGEYRDWMIANTTLISGGGGECTKEHIIIVDELPEVGVEGAYYGLKAFVDLVMMFDGMAFSVVEAGMPINIVAVTSEKFHNISRDVSSHYYLTDTKEFYSFDTVSETWMETSSLYGGFLDEIDSIDEADTSKTEGFYLVRGNKLYQYKSGQFAQLSTKLEIQGDLMFESNGDGTCQVSGTTENYNNSKLVIPSVSPNGDTVTRIGSTAFYEWGGSKYAFSEVTIPNTVTEIGNDAFRYALFKSIEIPDSVTTIEDYAFADNYGLSSITFPDSVTNIGGDVCNGCCSLYSVTISNNVKTIYAQSFNGCISLMELVIGNSVSIIERSAFSGCSRISSLRLPSSITKIEAWSFSGCRALNYISFAGTVEQWRSIELQTNWNNGVPATKVICSDGEVAL